MCQRSWPRSFQLAAVPALPIVRSSARLLPRLHGNTTRARSGCVRKGNSILASRTFNRGFLPFFLFERKKGTSPFKQRAPRRGRWAYESAQRAHGVCPASSRYAWCVVVFQFLTRSRSALDIYRLCSVLDESCRHAVHSGLGVGIHSMRPVPTGGHVR